MTNRKQRCNHEKHEQKKSALFHPGNRKKLRQKGMGAALRPDDLDCVLGLTHESDVVSALHPVEPSVAFGESRKTCKVKVEMGSCEGEGRAMKSTRRHAGTSMLR